MEVIQELPQIQCCLCGIGFIPPSASQLMCLNCISQQQSIVAGLTREAILNFCRHCKRYLSQTWLNIGRESKELLSLCLKKVRGIKQYKLIDAGFIWTEEHSRRVKVRITVQKEVQSGLVIQDSLIIDFREHYMQCDDCKKEYTPHNWVASVQVRQRSAHKKILLFLEQIILKLGVHEKCVNIKQSEEGLDFFFRNKQQAQSMVDFIQSQVPVKVKTSKQLISADYNSNTYNYKFTFNLELPRINRYDLIVVDHMMQKELGGCSQVLICSKVGKFIQLLDNTGLNGKKIELDAERYFNYEDKGHISEYIPFRTNHTEFMVIDVDYNDNDTNKLNSSNSVDMSQFSKSFLSIKKSAYIRVQRTDDWQEFNIRSHLGEVLRYGNIVLGFDLTRLSLLNDNKFNNEVVLVMRQKNPNKKKRLYKLNRINAEQENGKVDLNEKQQNDMEDLMMEIDRDPMTRKKVNLYKDPKAIKEKKKERMEKYKDKQTLQEKIKQIQEQKLKEKGRKILKITKDKKQQKDKKQDSDDEWVDCETDEENEDAVGLAELLDDMKLDDNANDDVDQYQNQIKENDHYIDQFISQLDNLKIHK